MARKSARVQRTSARTSRVRPYAPAPRPSTVGTRVLTGKIGVASLGPRAGGGLTPAKVTGRVIPYVVLHETLRREGERGQLPETVPIDIDSGVPSAPLRQRRRE